MQWHVRHKSIDLTAPKVMGIINTSPDSFSGDGVANAGSALAQAKQMLAHGAAILDIGGESSRPGADTISEADERNRVVPVVTALAKETDAMLSVDTYKPTVAKAALEAGAHIINDITGLSHPGMAPIVARFQAGVVIMHMQGMPKTMQHAPKYTNVVAEVKQFFCERITLALKAGIREDHIVLDPGIGFGKTLAHNLALLNHLNQFSQPFHDTRTFPVLVGTSRKSFIGKLTGQSQAANREFGTAASIAIAVYNGASLVRVHNVAAAADVVAVAHALTIGGTHTA